MIACVGACAKMRYKKADLHEKQFVTCQHYLVGAPRLLCERPGLGIFQAILDLTLQDGCKLLKTLLLMRAEGADWEHLLHALPSKYHLRRKVWQTRHDRRLD